MNHTEARARVVSMVQATVDPELTSDEVDSLVYDARRSDSGGNLPANISTAPAHAVSTAYVYGDVVQAANRWWKCITAGTTASTAPTWPDLRGYVRGEGIVTDGYVVWQDNGAAWRPTYDLRAAAAAGWELKASKVVGRFDFLTDNQNFKRSQTHAHCMMMAAHFRRRLVGSVPLGLG